jgi:hypothetical protein
MGKEFKKLQGAKKMSGGSQIGLARGIRLRGNTSDTKWQCGVDFLVKVTNVLEKNLEQRKSHVFRGFVQT